MAKAICVNCGAKKSAPWKPCKACGLDPQGDEELLLRSVYLSLGRFEDETDQERYGQELDKIGRAIAGGEAFLFEPGELTRLRSQLRAFQQIPLSAVLWTLFLWALPGLLIIIGLWGVGLLIDWLL